MRYFEAPLYQSYKETKEDRNLDLLIAEHIFGFTVSTYHDEFAYPEMPLSILYKNTFKGSLPHYSTNIKDAWQVLVKISESGWSALVYHKWAYPDKPDGCTLDRVGSTQVSVFHKDVCVAICLAALKAVGVEVE